MTLLAVRERVPTCHTRQRDGHGMSQVQAWLRAPRTTPLGRETSCRSKGRGRCERQQPWHVGVENLTNAQHDMQKTGSKNTTEASIENQRMTVHGTSSSSFLTLSLFLTSPHLYRGRDPLRKRNWKGKTHSFEHETPRERSKALSSSDNPAQESASSCVSPSSIRLQHLASCTNVCNHLPTPGLGQGCHQVSKHGHCPSYQSPSKLLADRFRRFGPDLHLISVFHQMFDLAHTRSVSRFRRRVVHRHYCRGSPCRDCLAW